MTTLTPEEFHKLSAEAEVKTKGMLAKQHATLKANNGTIPDEPMPAHTKGMPILPYDSMASGYTIWIDNEPPTHGIEFIKLIRALIPDATLIEAVKMRDGIIPVVENVEGMTAQALYLSLTSAEATLTLSVTKTGSIVPLYVPQPSVAPELKATVEKIAEAVGKAEAEAEAEAQMDATKDAEPDLNPHAYHYDDETSEQQEPEAEPEKISEPQEIWQIQNWYCDACEVYHNKGTKCPVEPTAALNEFEVVFTAAPVVMRVQAKDQEEANRIAQGTFDPLRTTWES